MTLHVISSKQPSAQAPTTDPCLPLSAPHNPAHRIAVPCISHITQDAKRPTATIDPPMPHSSIRMIQHLRPDDATTPINIPHPFTASLAVRQGHVRVREEHEQRREDGDDAARRDGRGGWRAGCEKRTCSVGAHPYCSYFLSSWSGSCSASSDMLLQLRPAFHASVSWQIAVPDVLRKEIEPKKEIETSRKVRPPHEIIIAAL